jgi:glucose-1-phosphate cytidylyltransferase
VSNVDITKVIAFHRQHRKLATLTAVIPPGRFGALDLNANSAIRSFEEKPKGDGAMVNGGFFVLSPEVINLIEDDGIVWERAPLEQLALQGQLMAYQHTGFWQPMDTLREKNLLEDLWASGKAPWKTWV